MSNLYGDLAAVRIQEWLDRTPALRLRRGASALLSDLTRADGSVVQAALPEIGDDMVRYRQLDGDLRVQLNSEAGDVDGVISLVVPDVEPGNAARDRARDALRTVIVGMAHSLHAHLPALPIQAVTSEPAETYIEAHAWIAKRIVAGTLVVDIPADPVERLLSRPCQWCTRSPAADTIRYRDKEFDVCPECRQRHEHAGFGEARDAPHIPRVERRLRSVWEATHDGGVVEFPASYRELAALDKDADSPDAATQIALVYADGNRLGALLAALAHSENHDLDKARVSQEVDRALDAALASALQALPMRTTTSGDGTQVPGEGLLGVIPHILGGDDVLVSVPASYSLAFTTTLLTAFGDEMKALTLAAGVSVTMSAGVLLAPNDTPFTTLRTEASRLLREAKTAVRGLRASIAFADRLSDGSHRPRLRKVLTPPDEEGTAPAGETPVTLAWTTVLEVLDKFEEAQIGKSARSTMLMLTREWDQAERPTGMVAALDELCLRSRRGHSKEWAAGLGLTDPDQLSLGNIQADNLAQLRTCLDLMRAWAPHDGSDNMVTPGHEDEEGSN